MRRLGMTTAIAAAALTAGCAAPGTTAQAQASQETTSAASAATPTPTASAATGSAPVATPVSDRSIPDGYDATRDAEADIQAALSKAAEDHREVLIDFGANWCPDCRALGKMFRSAQVEPLLEKNYVVVAVDVGQFNHNLDLAGRYVDLRTSGIPALAVLKPSGVLRTATNDGSFSDARSMAPGRISAFLTRWAPAGNP
ncbi:thioredoxin family protein [Streptomyces sp. MS06]|uniref:thioredoxin family protein n=1 Tax=Streptomyces sp. MS06 TaxID=3385974 RepID=UPI0039A10D8A